MELDLIIAAVLSFYLDINRSIRERIDEPL